MDEDASFAVEIAHEENELGYTAACLQVRKIYVYMLYLHTYLYISEYI